MQPLSPRFTLLCMKELGINPPSMAEQVAQFKPSHYLLDKTRVLQAYGEGNLERIKCIDDNYFYKCKISNVRGAIWIDEPVHDLTWWIVAGGQRKADSRSDFYSDLESKCQNKMRENRQSDPSFKLGKSSHSDWLRPQKRRL